MKKIAFNNKSYKGISGYEMELIDFIKDYHLFNINLIRKLSNWQTSRIKNILASLKKKGIITQLKKNSYTMSTSITENIFQISTAITNPSYVSFWTAMSYYGYTDQQLNTIQVISIKQHAKLKINNFIIEPLVYNPKRFYGYQKVRGIILAEKEKLLIDCLYKPEKAGGIEELKKCLKNMWDDIDQKKLIQYLLKFDNKSINSRLGCLLESLSIKARIISFLLKHLPKGYIKLNPAKNTIPKYDKKWR